MIQEAPSRARGDAFVIQKRQFWIRDRPSRARGAPSGVGKNLPRFRNVLPVLGNVLWRLRKVLWQLGKMFSLPGMVG